MAWLINRAKERSTWLGLIALLSGFGLKLNPEMADSIMALGLAAAGFIGVLTQDKK